VTPANQQRVEKVSDTGPATLMAEALAIRELGATVLSATNIGTHAIDYGLHGWPVFPCRAKVPAISSPHAGGSRGRAHRECGGRCGRPGHGVLDATTDPALIAMWWGDKYVGLNIGGRVPESMVMIDIDPYKSGLESLAALEKNFDKLPATLTDFSGRGDGGIHYWFRRPAGKLTDRRLGDGIDIKTSTGYAILPPSLHPLTNKPYIRIEAPVAAPPVWLIDLLQVGESARPWTPRAPHQRESGLEVFGGSIADEFSANASWVDVLGPHGWRCPDADPDADGARWLHPTHTSSCSATIRHGCLFVYSPNTPFETTESGDPNGYTKFRAHAVLDHHGDLSAAARALSGLGVV
jgi:hypothetical protein